MITAAQFAARTPLRADGAAGAADPGAGPAP